MAAQPEHDDDDLIAALLCGERDPGEPEVQELFRRHPGCRERYLRLRDLAVDLDEHGVDERSASQAASWAPSPYDALAQDLVLRHARQGRRLWWPLLLAAAAGIAIALMVPWGSRTPAAPEDLTLGVEQPKLGQIWPVDASTGYGVFRWNLPMEPGGGYVLRFHGAGPESDEGLVIAGLATAEWRPTAQDLGRLKEATAWEIEVLDASGRVVGGAGPVAIQRR